MSRSSHGGRAELGQNHLHDRRVIQRLASLVDDRPGPILEIGCGDGALTRALHRLGRPLTCLDLDEHRVAALRRELAGVTILRADILRFRIGPDHRVVVGNLPFAITTGVLRRLYAAPHWQSAVLLVQWEVARRRAGVGGASLLTAQTAPWFTAELHGRVPARAFRPVPGVDGGILRLDRRARPLLPSAERRAYERFLREVFTGPGRGLADIVRRTGRIEPRDLRAWLAERPQLRQALPRTLAAEDWADLWAVARKRPAWRGDQ